MDMLLSHARRHLANLVDETMRTQQRTVLLRNGRPVAAVVPIEDADYLQALEDAADAEATQKADAEGVFVDWEDVKKGIA